MNHPMTPEAMERARLSRPRPHWSRAAAAAVAAGALAAAALAEPQSAQAPVRLAVSESAALDWDRRAVEHLWNRAGFGIAPGDIDRWVALGPEALVDFLLAPRPMEGQQVAPPYTFEEPRIDPVEYEQRTIDERREYRKIRQRVFRREFKELRSDWVQRMVSGEDPLRDRMTLFWHGLFTTSFENVGHPLTISQQHETLRAGALGSYESLLRAMLRDPAMLQYLDNDKNRKGKPNENLAREVMELFSLGVGGGYTEEDVRQAARALTGAGVVGKRDGARYRFMRRQHDRDPKTILGVEGDHGPDDLATILVQQPACSRYIAARMLDYLEGVPAAEERVERYAHALRSTGYDIRLFLRKLFLDPHFYSGDVVGARIASPVDYVVGMTVRLGARVPTHFLVEAASALGEDLFRPPNVKGWEGGVAWISTSSFMLRGNIAGAVLARVDGRTLRRDTAALMDDLAESGDMAEMSMDEMKEMGRTQARRDEMSKLTRILVNEKFKPGISLAKLTASQGAKSDGDVVRALSDQLLAIVPPEETLTMLERRMKDLREAAALERKEIQRAKERGKRKNAKAPGREAILRELSHLILSLPEAQLH